MLTNIKTLQEAHPGTYDVGLSDFVEIYNQVHGDNALTWIYIFKYGFLKGQRAERASAKKKAAKTASTTI